MTDERELVAQLVRDAQQGDQVAFGELFERFERHVFSVALRRLGDFNEAQELTQDVFVQAMQKIAQLRDPHCFGGWLRSITHRMAINRAVRRAPDLPTEPEKLEAACVQDNTPLSALLAGERAAQLRAGLSRLGELDRATLVAFYVKGQSLLEMSDEFNAPLGTIKRRLHVARKRLAKEVEPMAV
ncbi:MAG: sigma-70 family RNA polymerase sigma factor [Planctomycetales bacterium]|nr:sigma-70 family RNA polymerase sigma factor [Planctomycetales bacterium]